MCFRRKFTGVKTACAPLVFPDPGEGDHNEIFFLFYLLQKGHKFAHEVAEDPSRQRVEGGGEGDAANQEDDVSGGQVCCRDNIHHMEEASLPPY